MKEESKEGYQEEALPKAQYLEEHKLLNVKEERLSKNSQIHSSQNLTLKAPSIDNDGYNA